MTKITWINKNQTDAEIIKTTINLTKNGYHFVVGDYDNFIFISNDDLNLNNNQLKIILETLSSLNGSNQWEIIELDNQEIKITI